MNRAPFLVVVTGIILLAGHFLRAPAIQAGAQGGGAAAAKTNGDCNGDGALNLTDAIYLLQHLFQGGPAPVPIQGTQPSPCAIPATGQTKCDCPGQDGFYQTGCPVEGRFVDNGDGTVTDNCTGLMWQKDTADVSGNASVGDEDRLDWEGALKYCESQSFAGHDDWRLPNVRELESIADYGRVGPSIDPVFGALSDWYWSSSVGADQPWVIWTVYFGGCGVDVTGAPAFVRAVRGGL